MNQTYARIRRWLLVVTAIALIAITVAGCSAQKSFTDGTGRTVTVKGTPKRIVSLNPAHTETLFAIGAGDSVVGVDSYSYRPAEATKKEQVGDAFNINLEKLVSLRPDLVILAGSKDMPPTQLKEMERLGIPAYVSGPATVKEVLSDIEALSKVVGREKQGRELVAKMQQELDGVASSLKVLSSVPRVFIVVDANLWTVGPNSFLSDVIASAGGENVMKDTDQAYLQVSMEDLVARDPDAFVVAIPEDQAAALTSRPAWSTLRAVQAGKVYFVNPDIVTRPGPAVTLGIKEVAARLTGSK